VMLIDGELLETLVQVDPKLYQQFVTLNQHGEKTMYVTLKKALYGCLQSVMLFWRKLSSVLIKMGFKINLYNRCVANKDINGHQCTITWWVDDLKISHVDETVVYDIIKDLERIFGQMSTEEGPKVLT